jgi:Ca2+-binding EF-hand superfamily protein
VSAEEFYAARGARIAERAGEGRMMRNLGQAPSFESFDTDGDGYLSPMELNAGHAARMAQRPGAGMGPAERAGFADFDRNGDGSVSREEFQQTREQRREMNARLGRPMRNQENAPEFDSFDANGDGVLTPNEFVPGRR